MQHEEEASGGLPDAMASAVARACNGVWRRSPQRSPEAEALQKLKHFWLLDVRWKPQICHFSKIWERKKSDICVIFARNHG